MKFSIEIKYYHPGLSIGLEDVRNAWYLPKNLPPVKLNTIVYQGLLTYRFPSSGKRISYTQLKKGLQKKQIIIQQPIYLLPF
jgi:hypothetical protein